MYLLSLWFYWPDPPASQKRSINFVSYISKKKYRLCIFYLFDFIARPTHKSKEKYQFCILYIYDFIAQTHPQVQERIYLWACIYLVYIYFLFHDDSFGFNIWHYLHHLLVHLFVSNGRTLSGSPLGDNLSRAKAALMLTMSIRLYPIHYLLRHFTYILFRF